MKNLGTFSDSVFVVGVSEVRFCSLEAVVCGALGGKVFLNSMMQCGRTWTVAAKVHCRLITSLLIITDFTQVQFIKSTTQQINRG